MNNEAITSSDWYDGGDVVVESYPQRTSTGQLKTNIFGNYVSHNNSSDTFLFAQNRSWCTALLRGIHGYPKGWLKIPCNDNFSASYFCEFKSKNARQESGPDKIQWKYKNLSQNKSGIRYISQHGGDYFIICPPRWIQIGMSCFRLFKEARQISFYDSKQVCRSNDSNIVTVEFDYLKTIGEHSLNIATRFKLSNKHIPIYRKAILDNALYDMSSAKSLNINMLNNTLAKNSSVIVSDKMENAYVLDGFELSENDIHPHLARILDVLYKTEPPEPKLNLIYNFWLENAHQKHTCLLLVPTFFDLFKKQRNLSESMTWSVVENRCNIAALMKFTLCQKDPIKVSLDCTTGYFKCWDTSCILNIYTCDGDKDCLAGEDETTDCADNAEKNAYNVLSRYLSTMVNYCKSYYISDRKRHNELSAHFYCDNIIHCSDKSDEFMCPSLLSSDSRFYKASSGEALHSCQNSQLGPRFSFGNLCKYRRQLDGVTDYCSSGRHLDTCAAVECSGMFKCFNSYCIPLHYICDGFSDCYSSEDEQGCSDLSCPGLLKCRGTASRCVGQWQICDGFIDCPSADDEILCHKCPLTCMCQSFKVWCWSNKVSLSEQHLQQTKYFTMMAYQPILNISSLITVHRNIIILQYIFSSIRKVVTHGSTENNDTFHTLYFNLSYNNINELKIIHFFNFQHLLVLDLSNNDISFVRGTKEEILPSLSALLLNNNSLITGTVSGLWGINSLQMVSLLNNPHLAFLKISSVPSIQNKMIYVDFESVCCEAYQTAVCVSTVKMIKCGSLLNLSSLPIPLLCIAALVLIESFIYCRALFNFHNKKAAYGRFLCHLGSSGILCGAYLFSISMMSIVMGSEYSRNNNSWITGVICGSLNFGLAVSIQINKWVIVTKSLLLNLAIGNPFRSYKSRVWRAHWILYTVAWIWAIVTGFSCFITYSRVVNGNAPMSTSRGMCASIILVDTFSFLSRLFSLLLILDSCLVIILLASSYIMTYRVSTIHKCFNDKNKAASVRKSRLCSNLLCSFLVHFLVVSPLIIYQLMFYIKSRSFQKYCQETVIMYLIIKEFGQFSYYVLSEILKEKNILKHRKSKHLK